MTRIFGRNELKQAILEVLGEVGPVNGYVLMQALEERIGSSWRPSPGAIYPALLALEELGLIEGRDDEGGGRVYELADRGRVDFAQHQGTLDRAAKRARAKRPELTLGTLLDRFAAGHPARRATLDEVGQQRVAAILDRATDELTTAVTISKSVSR